MNTTWKQLSAPLRVAIAAPSCVLALFVSLALAGGVELRLGPDHKPLSDVSLASPHWTDTLDPARLPASVPLLDGSQTLHLPVNLTVVGDISTSTISTTYQEVDIAGSLTWDNGFSGSDGEGSLRVGSSVYIGDSTSGAGLHGPSGALWSDNGNAGWTGPGNMNFYGDGSASFPGSVNISSLQIFGSVYDTNGSVVLESNSGNLTANNDLYVYGNFQLGNAAVSETVTPDCTLIVYDTDGGAIKLIGQHQ